MTSWEAPRRVRSSGPPRNAKQKENLIKHGNLAA
jgi:hypothetical protein